MSRGLTFALALAAAASTFLRAEVSPELPGEAKQGYTLAWHDEFEGEKLDGKEWGIRTGSRFASANLPGNVAVSGGQLHLLLKKEDSGDRHYTSGGIISKREFQYGYYEARFRVPPGAGWHTSFWMLKNSPGSRGNRQEIDVCEQDSKDLTSYGANLHLQAPEHRGLGGRRIVTPNLAADFHIWGCEFLPHEIRHYFDGKLVGVVRADSFQHDPMSIWLTTVGWADLPWAPQLKIDDTALPASADFDYVRFFTRPDIEKTPPVTPRSVLVFGDSLTEGGALPKEQRDHLWLRTVEAESHGQLVLLNEGKGGRPTKSTTEFDAALSRHPRADVVVFALGTNDSRDLSTDCVPKAVANLKWMINRARQTYGPNVPIVLVGPPNLNKDALVATKPIGKEREARLKELGDAYAKLASETDCHFVSLFGAVPEETMLKDGVHPDAPGNDAMAKVLLPALLEEAR